MISLPLKPQLLLYFSTCLRNQCRAADRLSLVYEAGAAVACRIGRRTSGSGSFDLPIPVEEFATTATDRSIL